MALAAIAMIASSRSVVNCLFRAGVFCLDGASFTLAPTTDRGLARAQVEAPICRFARPRALYRHEHCRRRGINVQRTHSFMPFNASSATSLGTVRCSAASRKRRLSSRVGASTPTPGAHTPGSARSHRPKAREISRGSAGWLRRPVRLKTRPLIRVAHNNQDIDTAITHSSRWTASLLNSLELPEEDR